VVVAAEGRFLLGRSPNSAKPIPELPVLSSAGMLNVGRTADSSLVRTEAACLGHFGSPAERGDESVAPKGPSTAKT
jgi:hypothetical protein